jgi:hypothetical protein
MQGTEELTMRTMTAVVFGGAALCSAAVWAGAPATEKPVWLSDFAAAQVQARREHRPILAVLH